MPRIANNFTKAICQNDLDERFTDGALVGTPINVAVVTGTGSDLGVLKNVNGNSKKTDYVAQFAFTNNAKTIGTGKNESDEKIYNFVKDTAFDYVIEYNKNTNTSVRVLKSSTGGVLNFVTGGRITNVDILIDAETGDTILAWSGDSNPPRIINVTRAKTWAVDGFTNDEISVMKPSPIFAPTISLTNIVAIEGTENNFINDKFLCFAYRYKYADGYYSAPSSWSRVAFQPKQFKVDFNTYENKGMLNSFNAVDITFKTGPRDVVQVDLLFRESNSSTVYVVQQFNKEEEAWSDDIDVPTPFQFSKSKIYTVLAEDQYFRNFDNVPLSAKAQTIIGNRIAYSNYIEGRNLGVAIDFDVELVSQNVVLDDITAENNDKTDIVLYKNVIDVTQGTQLSGAWANQMDYLTNIISVNMSAMGSTNRAKFIVEVNPKAGYSSVSYTLYAMEGTTVLQTFASLTGNTSSEYETLVDKNVHFVVVSAEEIIYDAKITYEAWVDIPSYPSALLSRWAYVTGEGLQQLVFPTSTTYPTNYDGDVISNVIAEFDMTGFEYKVGKQIRVNFELKSSLSEDFTPSVSYIYNLTDDFTNLADFIADSDFKEQLEGVFSENFKTDEISKLSPTFVFTGFLLSYTGETLLITMPKVLYTITEVGGPIDKMEFYILRGGVFPTTLQTSTSNAFTSLHSNRDKEVGLIYMDAQGRKSTVLNSKNNTIHIPAGDSDKTNKAKVAINNQPPTWAKYYKFVIKDTKKGYETLFGNVVYKDGVYRWIKLEGENKDKVKEGDLLTLKVDYAGVVPIVEKVKVLEIKTQPDNFIEGNKIGDTDKELKELPGLYFKIKQGAFDIEINQESTESYTGTGKRRYASRSFVTTSPYFGFYDGATWVPTEIKIGTQIRFFVEIKMYGSNSFNHKFEIQLNAQADYLGSPTTSAFREWFETEVEPLENWVEFSNSYLKEYEWGTNDSTFKVKPWRDGTASRDVMTYVTFDVVFSGGTLVFETEPIEQLNDSFYETPETFNVINTNSNTTATGIPALSTNITLSVSNSEIAVGQLVSGLNIAPNTYVSAIDGTALTLSIASTNVAPISSAVTLTFFGHELSEHILDQAFDCFTFGNGVESFKIQDALTGKSFSIDSNPTNINKEGYRKMNRFADITYSETYNSNSNINRLNEFNLSLANFKDDLDNSFGPVIRMKGEETNLEIYQEDKDSIVYYGKDLLYNADGTTTLTGIPQVLGIQKPYEGEFGISAHPDSYDYYGFDTYHTDVKRGVVIKKSNNGLFEISKQGMRSYFKKLFRDNTILHINGKYDQFFNIYVLNIQYNDGSDNRYVTWIYSDEANGWLSTQSFNPEDMIRLNGQFYSFNKGEIYLHNDINAPYNTFYGYFNNSVASFNLSQQASERKVFKTIEVQGNIAPLVAVETDMDSGYVSSGDFEKKENINFAYIRMNNAPNTELLSQQGIGTATVAGMVLTFAFPLSSQISIGDKIRNASMEEVGTIVAKTENTLTLNAVNFFTSGNYVLCSKEQSVEQQGVLGYFMKTTLTFTSTSQVEIYEVASEINKSYN